MSVPPLTQSAFLCLNTFSLSCVFPFFKAGPSVIADLNFMFDLVQGLPLTFKPEIDNFTSDPFIPKNPWEIIESGEFNHVPTMVGANSQEGLLSSLFFYQNKTFMDDIAEKWDTSYGPLVIFHR